MTVHAEDLGTPRLSNTADLMVTATVVRNNNPPVFRNKAYADVINQDTITGTSVLQVIATDNDPPVSKISLYN